MMNANPQPSWAWLSNQTPWRDGAADDPTVRIAVVRQLVTAGSDFPAWERQVRRPWWRRVVTMTTLRPAVVHPTATTPQWIRDLWRARGLCMQCGQRPYATEWAGNGWLICWPCCEARQDSAS